MLTQRVNRRRLLPKRRQTLEALGFEFEPHMVDWEKRFQHLCAFRKRFGHCTIPKRGRKNRSLYFWMTTQRVCKDKLTAEQRRRLDAIGFDWNPAAGNFERRFAELRAFKRRFGHCRVPRNWPENVKLSLWVFTQRRWRRRNILTPERRRRLNQIGFAWRLRERAPQVDWDTRFQQLKAFRLQYGHCRVPVGWPRNPALGRWVRFQRFHRAMLPRQRRQRLNALGFDWSPIDSQWERRVAELQAYRKQHGHCWVPYRWAGNIPLSYWVALQRMRWRRRTLPPRQRGQLARLGLWSPRPQK